MMRVTNNMIHSNLVNNLNRQQEAMSKNQMEGSTGTRINSPSDDPAGSARKMFYETRLAEYEQYGKNVVSAKGRMEFTDGQLAAVTDILHRIREITVQAANGTYNEFDRSEAAGREVEELLMGLVDIANSKDPTGRNLFGGSVIEREAFRPIFANSLVEGVDNGRALTGVVYQGDNLGLAREIERGTQVDVSTPGSKAFWGTNMTISSNQDASNFVALGDGSFSIDGIRIEVNAGDNLDDIVNKINNSPIEVSASVGGNNGLVLTSDTPHQIWMEDRAGGTILQDLGLIDPANTTPGNNINPAAIVAGQSIFDVVIQLRDDLLNNDVLSIGGRDLEGLDMAMENVLRYQAEVSSRVGRLDKHYRRLTWDHTMTQELRSKNESVDFAETIMNFKWLENVHGYTLRVGADLIKPTLMDFLR
ncbi:MAG: flagellar hook-associated protein 3 [Leptospirales bacterium]